MIRSLVGIVLLLVGGVVFLLGVGVVSWISAEDRETAREDARLQQEAAERELRSLAGDLVRQYGGIATSLVDARDDRLRDRMRQMPLGIHRDRVDGSPDLEGLRQALQLEFNLHGREERLGHVVPQVL